MKIIEETVTTKYVVFDNGVKEKLDTVLEYLNDMDSINIENTYTWFDMEYNVDRALFHLIINKDTFNDKVGICVRRDKDTTIIHWKENASEFINNLMDELCKMSVENAPIENTITIPEGATNGEVLNIILDIDKNCVDIQKSDGYVLEVKKLQELLNQSNLGIKLQEDGLFGGNTENAVKLFQQKYKLKVDGICGGQTLDKLLELYPNQL